MNRGLITRVAAAFLLCAPALGGARGQEPPGAANSQNPALKEVEVGAAAFRLGDPVPDWVEPAAIPPAGAKAPVVIRLDDTQIMVADTQVVHVHRALEVNDAAALTAAGQLSIGFVPEYQRLHLHAVRVLRDGETLDRTSSSTVRFLQRETALELGMYSGEVTASILVNDLRVGDTLEVVYSVEGQNPVFGGRYAGIVAIDQRAPQQSRRVILNYPERRPIGWRRAGPWPADAAAPVEESRDGMHRLRFQEAPVAEAAFEPGTPPDHIGYRALQFSEYRGWDEVVSWANGLFTAARVTNPELRAVVERLRGLPGDEERVSAALEFVQSQIRYFSVSLGESSHRPAAPDVVIGRRYGDCKDKSLLLMSLLTEAGIESHPVLLNLGRRKALHDMLPMPQLFDHVIVKVTLGGRDYWLDPTRLGQHGRLARMGQTHEGTEVLPIAPGVTGYTTISTPGIADLVRNEVVETAELPKFDGDAAFTVRQTWTGAGAEHVRVLFERLQGQRLTKLFGDALESRYPGTRIVGEPHVDDDRDANVVTATAAYSVPGLAIERDGNYMVRFAPANLTGALATPPSSVRKTPLGVLRFPSDSRYSIEVKFPDNVSNLGDPQITTKEDAWFSYRLEETFRGNVAKTTLALTTLADEIAPADIKAYAQDLQLLNNVRSAIFVPKEAIKSGDAATPGGSDFVAVLRGRLTDATAKLTETIGSGKLSGRDLAEPYCRRGEAFSDLGHFEEARKDAAEALKLAPNSGKSFLCRAYVNFNAGDFGKSIDDYSSAIAFGSTDPHTFYMRGLASFYAGDLDDAAADFGKASAASDNQTTLYSDLWLSWTLQRLGRPVPEAVAKRAAADPRGDWPRPALAMINGGLTPEEMLRIVDAKSGDDARMALAEGYFYAGQRYLVLGDKAKAREYFEKTRALEVIIYTEHVAAGFELKKLAREGATAGHAGTGVGSGAGIGSGTATETATGGGH